MSKPADNFQSPFLDVTTFPRQQSEAVEGNASPADLPSYSPFFSTYGIEGGEERVDPDSEEFIQFLGELHDEGFDDAVFELINEASTLYEDRFIHEYQDATSQPIDAERFLQAHFEPLENELELLLDTLVADLENRDFATMTAFEIEALIDSYQPTRELSPNFENFGGWFKKKLKKAAKWAKKKGKALAARAFRAAAKKMRRYLKPLLKKILTFAIGKLPKKYQGMATLLRQKLGYEIEEKIFFEGEQDSTGETDQIQKEFDLFIANVLHTDDEMKHELMLAEIIDESEQPLSDDVADLDSARETFIDGILDLKEGESAEPVVEEFLPAVMWAVKIGLKFYGRPKLVNYLAKYLANLIKRYVGRKYALPLSKVIVNAGLRLVNLELTEEETIRAAGGAVAAMVEDTLYEVANLPDYILDDEELLEGFVMEAFEKAAIRNLPEVLPEETYIKRPNLRESKGLKGTWVHKLNRRKRSYKKFTRSLKAKLSHHKLQAVKSFAEVPLSEVIENQYGVATGADLDVTAHLYEAIPGTTLSQISRYENNTPGLGLGKQAYTQLHPLTPEAAGMLFGEPGLGRSVSGKYLISRRRIGVGQRFYYLEIPGVQLRRATTAGTSVHIIPRCGLKLILDFSQQQIRVSLFFRESHAQNIAVKLRQQMSVGAVMTVVQSILVAGLKNVLSADGGGNVKIIHAAIPPQQIRSALLNLSPKFKYNLQTRLLDWLGRGMSDYFRHKTEGFIAATEDRADGVTLMLTLDNPPDFVLLATVLKGAMVSAGNISFSGDVPQTHIKAIPGYYNE